MRPQIGVLLAVMLFPWAFASASDNWPTPPATTDSTSPQVSGPLTGGTADHSKFAEFKGPFESGPEITRGCLSCHNETGKHFMKNIH